MTEQKNMEEGANAFCQRVADEYRERYRKLTPQQKWEADVRRACRIIEYFTGTEQVSPRAEEEYRRWLAKNCDKEYVREAISRVFDAAMEMA
jgi:hypothetical protein